MQEITSDERGFSEVRIEGERFLAASLVLKDSPTPVRLIVLKSFDHASQFVTRVSQIVIAMSLVAILIGCGLVLLISHRFTKPLDDLLEGVRALEERNFDYPLVGSGNDEFGQLTTSFNHMRSSLAAAEEKVRESERSATIGRMASSISHDLRHRLTAVLANSEFLAEAGLGPERKQELYENVRSAVRKMTDLLESLVEFSRTPESLRLEFMSVQEIVDDSIAAIRLHPQFQNVVIRIEAPQTVRGLFDAKRLERGLYNLLLNSCEVVPFASGCIQISIRRVAEQVEIRVADNGPGIAECIRKNLFQPFVSYAKAHGSGLGLAIVQKACLDHGGTLLLENASPGVTTFLMRLPLGAPFKSGELDEGFAELVHGASYGS
jgi:signal transduction histidine kinase